MLTAGNPVVDVVWTTHPLRLTVVACFLVTVTLAGASHHHVVELSLIMTAAAAHEP